MKTGLLDYGIKKLIPTPESFNPACCLRMSVANISVLS